MHKTKNKGNQQAEWKTKQDQTNQDGATNYWLLIDLF